VLADLFIYHRSCCAVSAQQSNTIQGRVSDSSHSPIANARIEFHSGTDTRLSTTDDNGTFIIPNVAREGTLLMSYPGFPPVTVGVRRDSLGNFLEIYLQPAPIVERILVSPAASDRISAVPNSQFSISKAGIHEVSKESERWLNGISSLGTRRLSSALGT